MSYGFPFVSPLPTPGVTASPTFEAQLIAWCQEAEGKLEQQVGVNPSDLFLSGGSSGFIPHVQTGVELPTAGASLLGCTYDATNLYAVAAAAGDTASFAIPAMTSDMLRQVDMWGRNSGGAWTFALLKINKNTGTVTTMDTKTSGIIAGTIEKLSIIVTETLNPDVAYVARWTAGTTLNRCLGIRVAMGGI